MMLTIVHTRFKITVRGKVVTVVILVVLFVQAKIIVRFLMTMVNDYEFQPELLLCSCARHGGFVLYKIIEQSGGAPLMSHGMDGLTDACNESGIANSKFFPLND